MVPPDRLTSLVQNPQALVSTQAQAQLQSAFSQLGPQLLQQIVRALRQALSSAISEVFIIGLIIMCIALVASFFLREIPLLKQYKDSNEPPAPPKTEK